MLSGAGLSNIKPRPLLRYDAEFGFVIWLPLIVFIDPIPPGVTIRERVPPEAVISTSLANPLQAFSTAQGYRRFRRGDLV